MKKSHSTIRYHQISRTGSKTAQTNVAIEATAILSINGVPWLTFQCTPDELDALAIGYLYNQGLIKSLNDVASLQVCDQEENIDVWLYHPVTKSNSVNRTTDCFNNPDSRDTDLEKLEYVDVNFSLHPEDIFTLVDQFLTRQTPHSIAGGVHTTAIADGNNIVLELSDIGRHNSLDKIAGRILLNNLVINKPVLLTTGRISSEIVQKTVHMRSACLVSLRSASQKGIILADHYGITLISGASRSRFNLLSHAERILIS